MRNPILSQRTYDKIYAEYRVLSGMGSLSKTMGFRLAGERVSYKTIKTRL